MTSSKKWNLFVSFDEKVLIFKTMVFGALNLSPSSISSHKDIVAQYALSTREVGKAHSLSEHERVAPATIRNR